MQEAQIFVLLPSVKVAHCKFGYRLVFGVGLYLPRKRFLLADIFVPFLQVKHIFISIGFYASIKKDTMQGLNLFFTIAILILSVIAHEVSHGFVAYLLGDNTAKRAGRLSINPLKHLDMTGSFIVPLLLVIMRSSFVFGWAKPVPYNPYNLKNQKWGPALVAISGPLSNFLIAGVFGLVVLFLPIDGSAKAEISLSAVGGATVFGAGYAPAFLFFSSMVIWINIFLGVFNLIPIPPLDGSKVLFSALPYKFNNVQIFLEKYGFFILLFFLFYFSKFLLPVVFLLFRLFLWI